MYSTKRRVRTNASVYSASAYTLMAGTFMKAASLSDFFHISTNNTYFRESLFPTAHENLLAFCPKIKWEKDMWSNHVDYEEIHWVLSRLLCWSWIDIVGNESQPTVGERDMNECFSSCSCRHQKIIDCFFLHLTLLAFETIFDWIHRNTKTCNSNSREKIGKTYD